MNFRKEEDSMFGKHNFSRVQPWPLLVALALAVILSLVGCRDLLGPEPPDCERNHTGTLTFHNRSSYSSYDVVLDGYIAGRIKPGESISKQVNAGQHSVRFKFSGTDRVGCSTAYPNVPQCDEISLSCSADY